jgi:hypothetical protein
VRAFALVGRSQALYRLVMRNHFGKEAGDRAERQAISTAMVIGSSVDAKEPKGEKVIVTVAPMLGFPMKLVGNDWKVDVAQLIANQRGTAVGLAAAYRDMAETYVRTSMLIQTGVIQSEREAVSQLGTLARSHADELSATTRPAGTALDVSNSPSTTLRAFLGASQSGDFDRALTLCDCRGADDNALAPAIVSLEFAKRQCLLRATERFGDAAARQAMRRSGPLEIDAVAADLPVHGERIEIVACGLPYRLDYVGGAWKIWIAGWYEVKPWPAARVTTAFRQAVERHQQAGERLQAEQIASPKELEAFLYPSKTR